MMQAPLRKLDRQRSARTELDLRVFFLHRLADLVIEFLAGFLELTHAAAETAGEFREFFGSEDQQHKKEDQNPFLSARHADCEDVGRVHLRGSLGVRLRVVKGKFRRIRSGNGGGRFRESLPGMPIAGTVNVEKVSAWRALRTRRFVSFRVQRIAAWLQKVSATAAAG